MIICILLIPRECLYLLIPKVDINSSSFDIELGAACYKRHRSSIPLQVQYFFLFFEITKGLKTNDVEMFRNDP